MEDNLGVWPQFQQNWLIYLYLRVRTSVSRRLTVWIKSSRSFTRRLLTVSSLEMRPFCLWRYFRAATRFRSRIHSSWNLIFVSAKSQFPPSPWKVVGPDSNEHTVHCSLVYLGDALFVSRHELYSVKVQSPFLDLIIVYLLQALPLRP